MILAHRIGRPITHGHCAGSGPTPEYSAWSAMRRRCLNPKAREYALYGGRGIQICERWMTLDNFIADMGPRPSSAHSLDRKDNDGNYEPGNCRWATLEEQANNRRTNVRISHDGQTLTVAQWAGRVGLSVHTLRGRLRQGWDIARALAGPVPEKRAANTCSKCGVAKTADDFYVGAAACKECTKVHVRARYVANREQIMMYERVRAQRPERRAKRIEYIAKLRKANPLKRKAWSSVAYAVRKGHLVRTPCEGCGATEVQAHHDDYSKPLDVKWLCFTCHREHEHGQTVTRTA